jgi:predicted transcriptional regulator
MKSAKGAVRQILDELPDDASLEDTQYHIYVRKKIETGLQDVEMGRTTEQDEIEQRLHKWLGK